MDISTNHVSVPAPSAPGPDSSLAVAAAAPVPPVPSPAADRTPDAAAAPGAAKPTPVTGALAQLLGSPHVAQPDQIAVTYRVTNHEIVTVFTDQNTGEEVAQFPKDVIEQLASFFDQTSGVTLDKNA